LSQESSSTLASWRTSAQQAVTSGGGPGDWKYGAIQTSGKPVEDATTLYFNITTPQSTSTGDTVFFGESAYDTAGSYDQEGIVGGGSSGGWWADTQNHDPCNSNTQWCAYFSFGATGYWNCSTTYSSFAYGPLKLSTEYQLVMSFAGSGVIDFYVYLEGASHSHTLQNSSTWNTGGSYFELANGFLACWNPLMPFDDFTVYEEDYGNNPVEPWPAFNIHTYTVIGPYGGGGVYKVPWSTYSISPPSGFPGSYQTWWYSPDNNLNISNVPFASWVGYPFGSGALTFTTSNIGSQNFFASIDPLADPTYGYTVYYQYNYVTIPASDISFYPSSSTVQADSYFTSPNAKMNVSLPNGFATGTYSLTLYAVESSGNTYVTMWWVDVT
jgi:hypothetical protein